MTRIPTSDIDRSSELMTLASAQVAHPLGYVRELKAAAAELQPDERAEMLFKLFRGRIAGRSGLLIITDRRLMFVQSFLWKTTVVTIPWSTVKDVRLIEAHFTSDLRISTTTRTWNFWLAGAEQKELSLIRDSLLKRATFEDAVRADGSGPSTSA